MKKFRQLFEDTDPEKIAGLSMGEYKLLGTQLQEQEMADASDVQDPQTRPALVAVPQEEEESTQTQMRDRLQALKRKAVDIEKDAPVEEVAETRGAKRRAVENVNPVEPMQPVNAKSSSKPPSKAVSVRQAKTQSQVSADSVSRQPDRDEAFLKAVASMKRGKKQEDEFDREFNNLRIAKPELNQYQEEWAVLDQFTDSDDLRGNFMVIVDIDVFKKGDTPIDAYRVSGGRADWEGRPNFKRFKQASRVHRIVP